MHLAALLIIILQPAQWHWALGMVIACNLAVVAATMCPRCQWLGPNLVRLPSDSAARGEIALTFDDGPDPEVTPAVLDLLDDYGVKASFFFIGERALAHSDLCRNVIQRGHAVENHTSRHRHTFALLGLRGYSRELSAGQQQLIAATGVRPSFFRAPAGFRNPLLWPLLMQHRLTLTGWTKRGFDTRCIKPNIVLRRLLHNLRAGDILLLHDGNAARTSTGQPVVLDVLPPLLTAIRQAGLTPVTLRASFGKLNVDVEPKTQGACNASSAASLQGTASFSSSGLTPHERDPDANVWRI